MKLRLLSMFVMMGTVSAWVTACSVQQGKPVCLVGHGEYAAKYILKPGQPTGVCAEKKAEMLGVEKYNRPDTPADQTIAILPQTLMDLAGGELPPGETQAQGLIALGKLDPALNGDPDKDNFCTAPDLAAATDAASGTSYKFTNVKFYVVPKIPGTQFTASLAYTEGGCTANYDVVGVFPAVYCGDSDGNPDQSLCALADDYYTHLALNPDFPVTCDPASLLCLLDGNTIPAVKSAQ